MKFKTLNKIFHWEYWPSYMFYIPNLPYALYLASKAKHIAFFSAANPSIKSSGNGTESKFKTIQLIPETYKPKSILHKANTTINQTIASIIKANINYPIIIKPDIGFRGLLVQKIESELELKNYLKQFTIDFIIQEFIDYKKECGIFYFRNPNDEKGSISSITLKKFLTVTGDGKTTLRELILNNKRAKTYSAILFKKHQNKLLSIPKQNESIILSEIGNHCRGTQFLNGNHLITEKLIETFDNLSKAIPGWFYGRIDLKFNDFKDIENGKSFKILEINGIIAEPTHIYDTTNTTYFKALKAIRTNWKSLYYISTINHKQYKIPYKSSKKMFSEMLALRAYTKKVKCACNKAAANGESTETTPKPKSSDIKLFNC